MEGVSRVIEGGQHNKIQFINLAILENTEMACDEYRKKFGIISQECEMVSHHTSISNDNQIKESQVLVVGTDTMPKQDWVRTRVFCWMVTLLYFNKLLQIPFLVLNKVYSVRYRQLIEWFLVSDESFPVVSQIFSFFNQKALSVQSGDVEFVPSKDRLNLYWPADEIAFMKICEKDTLSVFYEEAKKIILSNISRCGVAIDERLIEDAFTANFELMKKPFVSKNKEIKSRFNLLDFYRDVLAGNDADLKEGDYRYEVMCSQDEWSSWDDWSKEVVWFGTKRGAYLYPFSKKDSSACEKIRR